MINYNKKNQISPKYQEKKKGVVTIQSTTNNTIVTFSDLEGNTLFWASSGTLGFKNSRKSTVFASGAVAETIAIKAYNLGYRFIVLKIKGLGFGKKNAIRAFIKSHLNILQIQETTPIPFNGCRPPKKRRI